MLRTQFQTKLAAEIPTVAIKISSDVVDKLENVLHSFKDTPEAFEKKLIRGGKQPRRRYKRYEGKTPRTSLTGPRHPFDHVLSMHDEAARSNGLDYGILDAPMI